MNPKSAIRPFLALFGQFLAFALRLKFILPIRTSYPQLQKPADKIVRFRARNLDVKVLLVVAVVDYFYVSQSHDLTSMLLH